jgi:hypothetical protein
MYMIYGVDSGSLRMPFNRADYFVKVPDPATDSPLPQFCAPRTGVLYKATVNQGTSSLAGAYAKIPLLDCVADMQVVLGWDISDGGKANSVNAYSSVDGLVVSTAVTGFQTSNIAAWLGNAQALREHLKLVKVYILVQEGKRDVNYTFPTPSIVVGDSGETSLTRSYALTTAQQQYRWKLYRIIVRPRNLVSNQR